MKIRPDELRDLVRRHGGIARVQTRRAREFNRATGRARSAWANTITCRDGWRRTLTRHEESALRDLPEALKAPAHFVEEP